MSLPILIQGCVEKDTKSQEQLYQLYAGKLFAVCLKYSKSYAEAQDNLQEGFLLIFDKIGQYNFKGSFDGWAKRVMINHVLQQYRKTTYLELVNDVVDDSETEIDDENINLEFLLKIVQELPDRYRLVFNLYVLDDYSHKEIAEMLDISIGTSKSNLARAKMILKEKIDKYNHNNLPSVKKMNDRKKIERLFQEKFKDFEVTPPPGVWDGIASQLEKKKEKRRIFPFWFNAKAAGIAAALVLGLFVLNNNQGWVNWNFNEASSDNNTVVEKGNASDKTTSKGINGEKPFNELPSGLNGNPNSNEGIVSATETETDTQRTQNTSITNTDEFSTESTSAKSQQTKSQSPSYISNQKSKTSAVLVHTEQNQSKSSGNTPSTSIANRQKTNSDNHSNDVDTNAPQLNVSQIADTGNLKKTEKEKQQTVKDEQLVQIAEIPNSKKETIVNHKDNAVVQKEALTVNDVNAKNQIAERKGVSDNVERINNEGISKDNKDLVNPKGIAVADEFKNKNAVNEKNSISDASSDKGNQLNNDLKNSVIVQKDIVVNPLGKEKKDSVVVAQVEENPLEKILKEKEKAKEKEKEEIVETPYSKWGVRPTIAALFSGSTQGSPISPEFADNDKTYDSKFGLGIGVDYRLSKKIAIRTGVSKIDMAYNTEGISFFTDLSGRMSSQRTMRNINRNAASENVIIQDRPRSTLIEVAFASNDVGVMKQELGYIEIPMEMSYKIIDKKFGLHLITGLSTLFLSDNKISIMSNGMTTEIGEANNLNKVHFSTNIGLGIKYNILKALEASVEPMFKYQINTFSNDSGSFRPFVMGVYSGLSYKF